MLFLKCHEVIRLLSKNRLAGPRFHVKQGRVFAVFGHVISLDGAVLSTAIVHLARLFPLILSALQNVFNIKILKR